MNTYQTEALVLRSRKYLEADSLLTLLTKDRGKVSAIAKGARKSSSKLRGGVQVFTHNEMVLYKGRNLDTVTQCQCLESFALLQENLRAVMAAGYWSELVDRLTPEGDGDIQLFRLVLAGYHMLCLSASDIIIRGLEIKLLAYLGYRPQLEQCVACGSELAENMKISFSSRQGGILCPQCAGSGTERDALPFTHETLKIWQQMLKIDLSKLTRLKVSAQGLLIMDRVMESFLIEQLDYPLKSRPLLKTIQ